jgi:two-component system, chemotaxis family, sensor histidine kinase and response regulator PixL
LSLEKAGYYVEQAKDGQEAVDRLLGGLRVQAVVCDVEMPRLDGYGVLGEIKGKLEFAALPIVMLTSRTNEKHRRLAINLGASDYFSKPYSEVDLLDRLAALIQGNS